MTVRALAQRIGLAARQVGQRRSTANRGVVAPHLFDELVEGGRPPRTRCRYSGISSSQSGVPCAISSTPVFIATTLHSNH